MKRYIKLFTSVNLKTVKVLSLMVISATLFYGCMEDEVLDLTKTDFESFQLPVNLAMPLAKGDIKLREVIDELDIEDFELKTYDDGLIYFDFNKIINIGKIIEVDVPDQAIREMIITDELPFPDIIPIPANDSFIVSREFKFEVDVQGGEIDRAVFESGLFDLYANNVLEGINDIEQTLKVTVIDLSLENRVFEETLTNVDFGNTNSFDISNYVLVTTGSGGTEYIRGTFNYKIKNTSNNIVAVPTPKELFFEFTMKEVKPRYVRGYFGTKELFQGDNIVDMPIIDSKYFEDSTLFFKDPQVHMTLTNPVGMPFRININEIRLINVFKEDSIKLTFDPDSFDVAAGSPEYRNGNEVEITPYIYEHRFDKDNSNIVEVAGRVFDEVFIDYNVISNPYGRDPEIDNVIRFDSAEIYVESHVVIPLWLKAQNINRRDTVDFDFEKEVLSGNDIDTVNTDQLDSIKVIFGLKNSIPIDITAQVYLADADFNLLDSIFSDPQKNKLAGAIVDANGETTAPGNTRIELVVGPETKDKWRTGKHVIFKVAAKTSDNKYVKVYDSIGIEYFIGFVASGKVNNALIDSGNNNENN